MYFDKGTLIIRIDFAWSKIEISFRLRSWQAFDIKTFKKLILLHSILKNSIF